MNPDYRDILSAFRAAHVEFLLVGAYAMAAYGLPRATGDIDLWVRCNSENASKIMMALTNFGAPLSGITEEDFTKPDLVFQVGVAPRRVDILTSIDGIDFEEAWLEHTNLALEGEEVPVISRTHLIRNKRASGRPKDRVDVIWLETEE
jgi:hypothetical protein